MQRRLRKNSRPLRLALLLMGALVALLAGCGVGDSFTGGGVPIGRAAIAGQAVSATSPNQPLANAIVYASVSTNSLSASAAANIGETLSATTDANGKFAFANIPVDTAPTSVRVVVDSGTSAYDTQQIFFSLNNGNMANLIVTLAPANLNISQVSAVVLPSAANIFTSLTGQVNAQLQDNTGATLPFTPSLLLIGDFTSVSPNGTFTSSKAQVGTVEAFWYNNLQTSATLSVQNNGNSSPPPPPGGGSATSIATK